MYAQRINHILLQDEEHYDPKNNPNNRDVLLSKPGS